MSEQHSKFKLPSDTFCALPWMHLSSRPDGKMRTCCTSNASSVQDPDSNVKIGGGEVGSKEMALENITALIHALKQLGLEREARAMAIETVIANGL